MIETHRLKNVVIFIQTILTFALSREIVNGRSEHRKAKGMNENIVNTKIFR